ncbi:helix-turn-helix domain-containing protein, partial [Rhodococcus erythropolis]
VVERDFATVRSVSEYANKIGYSEKTVLRATRAAAGMTAKQYIDQRVVLEAKRLLSFGTDTVTQVASKLGFDDSANFTKFFATRVGVSPLTFRQDVRAR